MLVLDHTYSMYTFCIKANTFVFKCHSNDSMNPSGNLTVYQNTVINTKAAQVEVVIQQYLRNCKFVTII